jgi:DNA repair exonuclease SbcCD ATPase subunit
MKVLKSLRVIALAGIVALPAGVAAAQDQDKSVTTSEEVRAKVSQAMDAIADYSAQERDQAVATAREAMAELDAEIERRADALRDGWDDMSEQARQTAKSQLADLREARNTLGERFGALQAGTADAWQELKTGFANAYDRLNAAWSEGEVGKPADKPVDGATDPSTEKPTSKPDDPPAN